MLSLGGGLRHHGLVAIGSMARMEPQALLEALLEELRREVKLLVSLHPPLESNVCLALPSYMELISSYSLVLLWCLHCLLVGHSMSISFQGLVSMVIY